MNDLVERLREFQENVSNDMIAHYETPEICVEAAAEIERLQAELAALKSQLNNKYGCETYPGRPSLTNPEVADAAFKTAFFDVLEPIKPSHESIQQIGWRYRDSDMFASYTYTEDIVRAETARQLGYKVDPVYLFTSFALKQGSGPVARVNKQGFIVEIDEDGIQMSEGTLLYLHPTPTDRDAERYRWFCDNANRNDSIVEHFSAMPYNPTKVDFDAAIDAAMSGSGL